MTGISQKPKVLIVEDSVAQAEILASLAGEAGFATAVYNSLPVGIGQILAKEKPSLVLLDLRLLGPDGEPVGDGFQICREIKRLQPTLPVVVISAEGEEEACDFAIMQGADAYLQKPFRIEDLKAVIDEVMNP